MLGQSASSLTTTLMAVWVLEAGLLDSDLLPTDCGTLAVGGSLGYSLPQFLDL